MSRVQSPKRYTPAEYYALEHAATYKSDYYKGEIIAMSSGTARHSLISSNITGEIRQRLKGKPCQSYESNLRIKVTATGLRTYPDASVICGPLELDDEDPNGETCTNPTVVFEVLSPATQVYDRTVKSRSYSQIESLRAFGLVDQDEPHVELYTRNDDGTWRFQWYDGLSATIPLPMIQIDLPLAEIYAGVEFSDPGPRLGKLRVSFHGAAALCHSRSLRYHLRLSQAQEVSPWQKATQSSVNRAAPPR